MFHIKAISLNTNEHTMNIMPILYFILKIFVHYVYCLAVFVVCLGEAKISCPS